MKVVLERKDCIKHLVCKTGPNDITCPERCIHYEKENANSGYPLLGDSLPDDDKIKLVASDEASGIDWNDITYKKEWQEGFIAGAEWMRSEIK